MLKLTLLLYLLLEIGWFAFTLEIVESGPDLVWVKESESLELSCQSDQPWQWCYWEIVPVTGLTISAGRTKRYQTFQGSPTYINPTMKFTLNETVCGLEIKSADYDGHNGHWKCHLADTDKDEQIKAEAFLQVQVAVEAKPTLVATIPDKGVDLNYQDKHRLGTLISLSCSTQLSRSNPLPMFNLWLVAQDGKSKQLLANSTDPNGASLKNFELTKSDKSKYFMCETIQDTFYNNFVTGEPLHLVYPPMLDVVSHLPYVFVNETLNIRIPFSSRPEPDDDQLSWKIEPLYHNGSKLNVINLPDDETELFMSYPLKKSNDVEDEYFAVIEVINITESVEITLIVSNEFGELRHSFPVNFAGPLPSPDGSVDVTATQAGIALWIIVLIAVVSILLLLLLFCCLICYKRRSERRKEEDLAKNQKNLYADVQSDSWNRKKPGEAGSTPMSLHDVRRGTGRDKRNGRKPQQPVTTVDLDQIPDNQLPMLEKIYTDATGTTPFLHRSMSDDNSTDSHDAVDSRLRGNEKVQGKSLENKIPEENEFNEDSSESDDFTGEENLFNEKLLDIQNTDPDVLGSMEDLEQGLVVIRRNEGRVDIVPDQNFFSAMPPDHQIVMTTGPTSYPVVTSPTSRTSFFPSPSYIPGRRTTQIDFLQQAEQPQQQQQPSQNNTLNRQQQPSQNNSLSRQQQQQQSQNNSLNRQQQQQQQQPYVRNGTFGRR